ncbi:alpha-hydroxy-acid oxidizing protein [Dermacoccus abyssi]|nr:alpha-hydroxy-acid oxidizing protein [Dermacoccus abyssi]
MTSSHHSRPIPAALERRMPDVRELASLVRFAKPSTDRVGRRLEKATSVWELREIAKRRTPKAPFDYVDGAAEAEISLRRSRLSYRNVEFVPHVLHDVSDADTSTEIFGRRVTMPLGHRPHRLHPDDAQRG